MPTTDRMLSVLKLFTADRSEWTVEGASRELRLSLSTCYRYFASLAKAGLIGMDGGGRYVLGPAAIEMDWLIRRTDPLTRASAPAMRLLASGLDRPSVVLLCRLYRHRVMCVAEYNAGFPDFASGYERGRLMPLFRGAASKIILANMPDRAVGELFRRHPEALDAAALGGTPREARATLARDRRAGLSVTSGEVDIGLTGMAAPVFGADGVLGSVAYVFKADALDLAAQVRFAELLRSAAGQVTAALAALDAEGRTEPPAAVEQPQMLAGDVAAPTAVQPVPAIRRTGRVR